MKNPLTHAAFISIYVTSIIALGGYLISKVNSDFSFIIIVFSIALLFLLLFIFEKRIRAPFFREIQIVFRRYSISIISTDLNSLTTNATIEFREIKFFKTIHAERNDFSILKLMLRNGTKVKYIFSGQENKVNSKTNINNIFRELVLEYNQSVVPDKRIKFAPTFWTTRAALYTQWAIGIGMATIMIYFVLKSPKTLSIFFILPLLYYGITLIRKQALKDKNLFN